MLARGGNTCCIHNKVWESIFVCVFFSCGTGHNIQTGGLQTCLIGSVNVVPDAESAPVLRHHDVAVRHPLYVRAVAQQGASGLGPQIVPGYKQ